MSHIYSEDQLVEQPAIGLFGALGWQTLSATEEIVGASSSSAPLPSDAGSLSLGRETRSDVVLLPRLRAALAALNPTLPPDAITRAIDELTRDRSAMSLAAANREVYRLLKEGIPVAPSPDPNQPHPVGEGRGEGIARVRVVDWEHPERNDFLLVSQLTIVGSLYTCRPDLVGFVNGLPWVVVELKAPSVAARVAFDHNLTHYKDQVPQLFWYNALLIASNGTDSRVGSLTADWERFFEWKRIEHEEEPRRVSLEVMLRGTCDRARLLDLVENFTLFSEHKAGLVKIIGQNHQVLGVNNAITSMLAAREQGHGRGGVFWQTQGSGKSFSMVFFAQKVLRKHAGNWTFVVVTDRVELDEQIAKTFKAVGAVSEAEGDQCHAQSGAHLRQLLRGNHRYIFTLIHKFQGTPSPPAPRPAGEGSRPHYRAGYTYAGLKDRARELRQRGTPAEGILWEALRNRRLGGMKFRRQHQIGDYIVDFFCTDASLIIELDGEIHDRPDIAAKDRHREAWLRAQGMTVLRFKNHQVLNDLDSVLTAIATLTPHPSPTENAAVPPSPPGDAVAPPSSAENAAVPPSPAGRGAGGEGLSDREDIIVMVDEAHRSQYDTLALNMRAALPRATFLAFTGTPLIAGEERTKEIFGDYVSIYDFQQSVEDGATVPLFYENRTPELQLVNPALNEDLYRLIENAGLDEEQEAKLENVLGRQYHLITRDDRLDTVARDIVHHFLGRGFVGKAMVVSIDKATALRMHDKVRVHWAAESERVRAELGVLDYEQGVGETPLDRARRAERQAELRAKLDVLTTTDMALIVSPGQNEIAQMRALGLDIEPHRRRMVESQPSLDERFKDVDDPLRLVFVCAMWLTGFDAPSCSTVYLDKPMRNHTLMQTIARANRVFPGKHSGVIVDYANVFASLEAALAIYGAGKDGATPVKDKQQLVASLRDAVGAATAFCQSHGVDLAALEATPLASLDRLAAVQDAVNALIAPEALRRDFVAHAQLVATLYRAVKPDPAALEFAERVATLAALADTIHATLNPSSPDISAIMGQVSELLDASITGLTIREDGPPPLDLSTINFEALADRFKASKHQNSDLEALKAAIRARLETMLRLNRTRTDFAETFEALIESYNAGSRSIEQLFEELLRLSGSLDDEQARHIRENLSEEELVIFDILTRPAPALSAAERAEVKRVARDLLARLRTLLVLNWRQKTSSRAQLTEAIEETLDSGLPQTYTPDLFKQKCRALFEHIYESYPERNTGVYANVA